MLIDWFTLIAQIIDFLILVFLLDRFLYRPILQTIRARQEQIDHHWQQAQEEQKTAEAQVFLYKEKQENLEQKRQEIITQAQKEGEKQYHNLLQQARQEVEQKQTTWEEAIAQQQEQFFENLEEKLTKQLYQIARRAFQEIADVQLEEQAIRTFVHRLENLDKQEQQSLAQCLQKSNNGLIIRSSFELTQGSSDKILDALHKQKIYEGNTVQFTTAPELICGIELQASDYKIPWNLKSYLLSLEKHFQI